jgi:excisionase family DNA binding protein
VTDKSTNGQNELLTPQEVGRILKMKPERVLAMARCGKLPRFKMGKFVRFRRSDVDALIERQMTAR